MVFYLDITLLLNFVIDYFILLASSKLLQLQYKKKRLLISAWLGASYTLIFFIPLVENLYILATKIFISIVMILISFGFVHLIQFLRTLTTFYFISFVMGGGVFAIQYLFNIKHDVVNGIYISRSSNPMIAVTIILFSFIGIWYFSNHTYKSIRRKTDIITKIVIVDIYINNGIYQYNGLIDTGNRLFDPVTRKPVMVVDVGEKSFIPDYFKETYINGRFNLDILDYISKKIDNYWLSRIHIVPYRSISSKMQFILAIRPDKVVIKVDEGNSFSKVNVLVGINYGQLSNDKTYNAIIHPELLVG